MKVEVNEVVHPVGIFDTIIKFKGTNPDTAETIIFAVDHRPAKDLFAAMKEASEQNDPPIVVHLEDWQILTTTEVIRGMSQNTRERSR